MASSNTEKKARNKMCEEVYFNLRKEKQTKSKKIIKILNLIINDTPDKSPSQGNNQFDSIYMNYVE